ncbi:hypothetical protein FH972_024511 [Carpinus fangiana]|uniref:C2H2-type domain-containing protein n=1 Tax=Carpinus fangiana TaxID=176857 RepID=A0A5N6KZ57_9ROSI|nr:hypothetical protein FH972_024511 [Carpinus fangiana]
MVSDPTVVAPESVQEQLEERAILNASRKCARAFAQSLSMLSAESRQFVLLENERGRFAIWAGNLGVFADANASADYRLREEKNTRDILCMLLRRLDKEVLVFPLTALDSASVSRQSGSSSPTEDSSNSDSSASTASSDLSTEDLRAPKNLKAIRNIVTKLYRLSAVIKKPNSTKESARVERYIEEEDKTDDYKELYDYAKSMIAFKFKDTAPMNLQSRLADSIVFRRKRIVYREKHHNKLSHGVDKAFEILTNTPSPALMDLLGDPTATRRAQALRKGIVPLRPLSGTNIGTEASSVNRKRLEAYPRSIAGSQITKNAAGRQAHLDVPPPPKIPSEATEILCPYCYRILKKGDLQRQNWTAHVLKDLQPYICIFDKCEKPKTHYRTEAEWITHMQWEHNIAWFCPSCRDHKAVAYSESDFEKHMRETHYGTFTDSQLAMLSQKCAQPRTELFVTPSDDHPHTYGTSDLLIECPLCGFTAKNAPQDGPAAARDETLDDKKAEAKLMQDHIARHLEDLALLSLPYRVESDMSSVNEDMRSRVEEDYKRDLLNDDMPIFEDEPTPVDDKSQGESSDFMANIDWVDLGICDAFGLVRDKIYPTPGNDFVLNGFLERAEQEAVSPSTKGGPLTKSESAQNLTDDADVNPLYDRKMRDLREAIAQGNVKAVKAGLTQNNIDINSKDFYGQTLLSSAAFYGHDSVVKLLLEQENVDADSKDSTGRTPLSWAAGRGHETAVNLLLARNDIDPLNGDQTGQTPLMWATRYNKQAIVRLITSRAGIIKKESDQQDGKATDNEAQTHTSSNIPRMALHPASATGSFESVLSLIQQGADLNIEINEYGTPLQAAIMTGSLEAIIMLIQHRADVNVKAGRYGTALQTASYEGWEQVVTILIEHGADINATGGEHGTALHAASYQGHEHIVRLLIRHRADLLIEAGEYGTALQAASCRGYRETVRTLIEAGANIHIQAGKYGTALQAASSEGHIELVRLFCQMGADVNAYGEGRYCTALQLALQEQNIATARLLLENDGIDVNLVGGALGSALYIASYRGYHEIVAMLLDRGAKIDFSGTLGTPLMAAESQDHLKVVTILKEAGAFKFADLDEELQTHLDTFESLKDEDPSLEKVSAACSLGILYERRGKMQSAEHMYEEALNGYETLVGPQNRSRLNMYHRLGDFYESQGRLEEAMKMYLHLFRDFEEAPDSKLPSTLRYALDLGDFYVRQYRLAEAEQAFLRVCEGENRFFESSTVCSASSLSKLGDVYAKQGKLPEAEEVLLRALQSEHQVFGRPEYPAYHTLQSLATIYERQGKSVEAADFRHRAYEMRRNMHEDREMPKLPIQRRSSLGI